jgi:hypothetical protein
MTDLTGPERVGYVVVCWNQASGQPDVVEWTFSHTRESAERDRDRERAITANVGRRETYAVAEVVPLEDST